MEGKRVEEILSLVDKFSFQILLIQISLILIIFAVFIWIWLYNKRKYNHLKHQIPATVVKNYLDSIIQNSTALKSSLFRGGGLDVDANSIPSVMSFKDLSSGLSSAALSTGSESEELNAKNAEIMRLRSELEAKVNVVRELEKELTGLKGEVKAKDERIAELERMLAEMRNSSADGNASPEVLGELEDTRKERDELRSRLAEYAIIEDDLANLKRLQQENAQLKKSLESRGSEGNNFETFNDEVSTDEIPSADKDSDLGIDEDELQAMEDALDSSDDEIQVEETFENQETEAQVEAQEDEVVAEPEAEPEAETAPAALSSDEEEEEPEEKSPEDLLSEFEKMLG